MTRSDLEREYAAATVTWAEEALELTDSEVATAVEAGRETVRRWRRRAGVPIDRHRRGLERLNQLRHLLDAEFDTPEQARSWLHTPLPGFGGRAPFSLIIDGQIDHVLAALETTVAGAFV